jgi:hypothetical protein
LRHSYGGKIAAFAKTSAGHWQDSNFCGTAFMGQLPLYLLLEVVQVDWIPPAGGDKEMIDLLDQLL